MNQRTTISRTARGEIAVTRQQLVAGNWVDISTKEITTGHIPAGNVVAVLITICPRQHLPVQEVSTDVDPETILPSIY